MTRITGGRDRMEPENFILMHREKFDAWLEKNNLRSRQQKKKWNNGETLPQMGGFSGFIDW